RLVALRRCSERLLMVAPYRICLLPLGTTRCIGAGARTDMDVPCSRGPLRRRVTSVEHDGRIRRALRIVARAVDRRLALLHGGGGDRERAPAIHNAPR